MNEHQELIIGILKNERNLHDEGLSYFIEHSESSRRNQIFLGTDKAMKERIYDLRRQVEEIDAAIEWVKRQMGE